VGAFVGCSVGRWVGNLVGDSVECHLPLDHGRISKTPSTSQKHHRQKQRRLQTLRLYNAKSTGSGGLHDSRPQGIMYHNSTCACFCISSTASFHVGLECSGQRQLLYPFSWLLPQIEEMTPTHALHQCTLLMLTALHLLLIRQTPICNIRYSYYWLSKTISAAIFIT
jgi:hypothetical protein